MTKHRNSVWSRTTKALGKWFAGMVTLPEDPRRVPVRGSNCNDYPRFPAF